MPERRKTWVQSHEISQVEAAINATVYGDTNRRMVHDVFVSDLTYEEAAERHNMTPSGFYKHIRKIAGPMENYLRKLN